jgi:soluble lytic murein transglycosylase-like protein
MNFTQPSAQTLATPIESTNASQSLVNQLQALPIATEECQVNTRFPFEITRWCSLVTHYSNLNGLSPNLIAALIWQESGGNPDAYSRSGAVGLMQIMPRDGIAANFQCINGPCFGNRPTSSELYDPEFNIEFGTQMLSRLLNRTGDLREALRSYGPMDVGYSYADKVLNIYQSYQE